MQLKMQNGPIIIILLKHMIAIHVKLNEITSRKSEESAQEWIEQEAHSEWIEQKRGCPQGSSFGPLLWSLFQNDLSLHRQSASLFTYAGDHQIYTNDNDIQKAAQTLRRQTKAVSQWYKENLLQANPQKYQILTIDPQPSKRTPEYALKMEFDGHEVKSLNILKFLV